MHRDKRPIDASGVAVLHRPEYRDADSYKPGCAGCIFNDHSSFCSLVPRCRGLVFFPVDARPLEKGEELCAPHTQDH
jgi:hypothetical protein